MYKYMGKMAISFDHNSKVFTVGIGNGVMKTRHFPYMGCKLDGLDYFDETPYVFNLINYDVRDGYERFFVLDGDIEDYGRFVDEAVRCIEFPQEH